jgi:putative spermidine/putrescine transport system permease protein
LLILPHFFPRIALAIALLLFFAQVGIAGTLLGLLLAHVVITLPYAVRTLMGSLSGMDPHIEEAALSLGANWLRTIWEVTLPLIRPGMVASGVFVFIISLDEVVISLFLAGPAQIPLSVRIFTYIQYTTDPTIAAISTILMTLSVMLFVLAPKEFLTGRGLLR